MTHQSAREIQDEAARWSVSGMDGAEWNDTDEAELAALARRGSSAARRCCRPVAAWRRSTRCGRANADGESLEARDKRFWRRPPALPDRRRRGDGRIARVGGAFLLGHDTDYGTQIGEIRFSAVADGSTTVINTASLACRPWEAAQRLVRSAGELWFQVAKDSPPLPGRGG